MVRHFRIIKILLATLLVVSMGCSDDSSGDDGSELSDDWMDEGEASSQSDPAMVPPPQPENEAADEEDSVQDVEEVVEVRAKY